MKLRILAIAVLSISLGSPVLADQTGEQPTSQTAGTGGTQCELVQKVQQAVDSGDMPAAQAVLSASFK